MVSFDSACGVWRYSFSALGREHVGECAGCSTESEALSFEEALRLEVGRVSRLSTVGAVLSERLDVLLEREGIPVVEAAERFLSLPRGRRTGEAREAYVRLYWGRFSDWLLSSRPMLRFVQEVDFGIASEYVRVLRSGGLSAHTANLAHSVLSEVFDGLNSLMRLPENPFRSVPLLRGVRHESREAFTPEEVSRMLSDCPPRLEPLLKLGLYTGMRVGDICTLRLRDVVFGSGGVALGLRRRQRKTGGEVSVPLLPAVSGLVGEAAASCRARLSAVGSEGDEDWLFPELAEQFLRNHQTVSQWVTRHLERLGISTTEKVEGYSRAVSRKGMHAFRHTFCSFAGTCGVPLNVVQSMVGHLSPRMTELYSRHVTEAAKAAYMERYGKFVASGGLAVLPSAG